jgi:hypothetical protein
MILGKGRGPGHKLVVPFGTPSQPDEPAACEAPPHAAEADGLHGAIFDPEAGKRA